jgi:hypothetical protein
MANPFQVEVPSLYEALLAGERGYKGMRDMQSQNAMSQARQEAQSALMGGGDTRSAMARLIGAGDMQGATAISNMESITANRDWQREEAKRAQLNADRSFRLQEQQFNATAGKPQYRDIDGPDGKQLLKIEPTGGVSVVNPEGASAGAANPFAQGKGNDEQQKARLYASRMFGAEKILRDVEAVGTDLRQKGLSKVPLVGNYLVSDDFQKLDQAKRDFVNAVLRRESGAVISDPEFANAEKQYFPQPGDSAETIKQKRANRAEAIKGIAGAGGSNWRPPAAFDAQGDLVPNAQTAPRPAAAPAAGGKDIRAQAQDAIARGADPKAVAQRLIDNNINPDEIGLSW